MAILLLCPSCQVKLRIPEDAAGKRVRCSECKHVFRSPKPGAAPTRGDRPLRETRVFISHAVADQPFVDEAVHQFFKSHNIATWCCSQDIPGGSDWDRQIDTGLKDCDWFVVVLSARAVRSEAVRKEVESAFESRRGRILPILMEPMTPEEIALLHPELPALQYEDFSKELDGRQRHLLVSMVRQLHRERHDWEGKAEHLGHVLEEMKDQSASHASRLRKLERQVRQATGFDGHWSDPVARGSVPEFAPLARRRVPIVAICNFKGGVGKTTLTANLGATLWGDRYRKRVLLVDLDYQGSLSSICLDQKWRSKLTQQHRFVQEIFSRDRPEANLVIQLAHEVDDERNRSREASILAADEDLMRAEAEVLGRWIVRDHPIDGRYLLRHVLHTSAVADNFDLVLLDCPPRMTAAAINAFLAADFLLVPTFLEEVSCESVPRLLRWVRERRQGLLANLDILGVVVTRTRQKTRLLENEKDLLHRLKDDCEDAAAARVFETCIPTFPAAANSYRYPAQHAELRQVFVDLVAELMPLVCRDLNQEAEQEALAEDFEAGETS